MYMNCDVCTVGSEGKSEWKESKAFSGLNAVFFNIWKEKKTVTVSDSESIKPIINLSLIYMYVYNQKQKLQRREKEARNW